MAKKKTSSNGLTVSCPKCGCLCIVPSTSGVYDCPDCGSEIDMDELGFYGPCTYCGNLVGVRMSKTKTNGFYKDLINSFRDTCMTITGPCPACKKRLAFCFESSIIHGMPAKTCVGCGKPIELI